MKHAPNYLLKIKKLTNLETCLAGPKILGKALWTSINAYIINAHFMNVVSQF